MSTQDNDSKYKTFFSELSRRKFIRVATAASVPRTMRIAQMQAFRKPFSVVEQVGDRVTIPFHEADGTCPYCRAGFQNMCDHMIMPGVGRTGGWAHASRVS